MKKKILSLMLACLLVVGVVALSGCSGKKSNPTKEISTSLNDVSTNSKIEYLEKNLAWNIFMEAKYKLTTSYENCLNNFQIETTNYWASGTRKNSSTMKYLKVQHENVLNAYVIRYTSLYDTNNKTDFLYYGNKRLDLMDNTIQEDQNYNALLYDKQMTCLTNEDICLENLLLCEIDKENNYILKFTKTFDSDEDYEDYVAYYEVEISNDKMFSRYRNYVKTNTSSGYINYSQTYAYNVVKGEELLSLIPN